MSIFVKRGNHDYITFKAQGDVNFNLSTLTFGGSYSNVGYELYPNDWVRLHHTTTSSSTNYFGIYLTDSSFNQFWNATGDEFVYVWGAQYETGTYPSSYIPTSGSAVTRTADTCSLPNFSNIPTDYPLTVYWKGEVKEFNGFNCAFSIYKDGEAGVFLVVSFNTSSQVLVRRADGSGEEVDFISFSYSIGDILKIGIKFTSATTFKLFINGALVHNETSGISKTWDFNSVLIGQLRIVADTGTRNPCNELMIFNEALTDAELTTLTT